MKNKSNRKSNPLGNLRASVEIQALHRRVDFQASDILQIFERKKEKKR
jgi:hypothetical protein